jgi:predicted DCC family thiol-disulfide oxidoreductase YuxK
MSDVTLVYDDDCGFCTWWADYIAERSDVELVGFSELTAETRERLPEDYEECAHLLLDGEVYSCGESIERALARSDLGVDFEPLFQFCRQFDEYPRFREWAYRQVADRRETFGKVMSKDPPAQSNS